MNRIHLLVGIALVMGISFAYAQETGTGTNQPLMPLDPTEAGMITQVMLHTPEANSTIIVQIEPEPRVHKIFFDSAYGTLTCSDGTTRGAGMTHQLEENLQHGFSHVVLTSDDIIIDVATLQVDARGYEMQYDMALFAMNKVGDQMIATGVMTDDSSQDCGPKIIPVIVIMDCGVGTLYEDETGATVMKNGTYAIYGQGPDAVTFISNPPYFTSYCQ